MQACSLHTKEAKAPLLLLLCAHADCHYPLVAGAQLPQKADGKQGRITFESIAWQSASEL